MATRVIGEFVKRSVYFLLLILVVVIGAFALSSFLQDNGQATRLRFIGFQTKEVSLAILVLISFLLGLVFSSVILLSSSFVKHLEARRLRRENEALQKLLEKKEASQKAFQEQLDEKVSESTPAHQKA